MTSTDARAALKDAVAAKPSTIAEVIALLQEVQRISSGWELGEHDGIASFSTLYLRITQDVNDRYEAGDLFHCGDFIVQLDVAFARRYVDALRAWVDGAADAPGCWTALFNRHDEQGIDPWRFAAAGVNAHVNFDLAFALLDVWEANPEPLATTDAQHADYDAINTIFYRRMDMLCDTFDAPWSVPNGETIWERAGDVLGDVLVWGTRDLAWRFAERMWRNHGRPDYRTGPTETLDLLATKMADTVL